MITTRGSELAEGLENHLSSLNDIDDAVATSSAECNYEDFEVFTEGVVLDLFEQDLTGVLKDLKKKAENLLISDEKCDVRLVFEESGIATMKFNLFVWYLLEKGKTSESSEEEVEKAVLVASCYVAMCAMPGSNYDLFQIGLYKKCLKVMQNCCQTVRIGETVTGKKSGAKKKSAKGGEDETNIEEEGGTKTAIGPPKIAVDSAERFLHQLTTQLFGFLRADVFSLDSQTLLNTLEVIEDIGRLDLDARTVTRSYRSNSVHEFRSLERFTDRYCSFVNALIESKYKTRGELAYGRLIRPRLALMPYPDEGNKTSKISTERKRAGELTVSFVLGRIDRKPGAKEMKLIETVMGMVYVQCPDLAEFRTNITQFIFKFLGRLPYQYAYDFVQLMHIVFKTRSPGVKSISTELANCLLSDFDFTAPDPGPVPEVNNGENEEEEEEEEDEDEEEEDGEGNGNEDGADKSGGEENDEEEEENSRKKKEKKEEKENTKKQKTAVKDVNRLEAMSVLYNIIYMACIDKSAAIRLHGSHSFSKILESETHRKAFHDWCEKLNREMDEKLGEVGDHLHESFVENEEEAPARKGKTDLLLDEQQIIQKFHKLKMMNKGEARVEKDIIYMLCRRLATDEKAPVKKSACVLLKMFLSYCDEQVKFEVALSVLQKMCRDKMVSVRKTAAESLTELMLHDAVKFKEILSSKWLHSLITMLNDTDNDVTEHARKLIMRVLTPLLETPSDLTWTLLDTIESVTNHRQYLMSTLKDAVREKLVKRTVMDSMRNHIESGPSDRKNGAWMVFSQLCVQFEHNVEFAIEAYHSADLSIECNHVQYIIHIIENSKKIEAEAKNDLIRSMRRTLTNYCLHPSHARSVYHCLGKLMDGIGDRATNGQEFRDFGEDLLVKCFDTIVQSFEMFKRKEEWKQNAENQERLLVTALNVVSEVFSFSPQLIPRHERLGKTLSLIVNSHDGQQADSTAVNPEMPSANHTRPPTQMSEVALSQKTSGGLLSEENVMFSAKVRAVCVITLANMILAHDRLLKLMPMLVKQLQTNQCHQIRSNIVVAIGDVCASYKTDRYAPMLAASLCDPSVLVRRHAINQIARLISLGIFRFNGEIMIRVMLATLDANEDVRNDAKLYISEVLQSEEPNFFPLNFVQYMLALTQAKRLIGTSHDEDDRGQVDVAIGGGDPLARPSRIAVYTFMIESLDDRSRFEVKRSICQRVFTPIVNGEYDFSDYNVQCLLDDALLIMSSNEMQVKMEVGKNPNENAMDEPSNEVVDAASNFLQKVYLDHYMNTIVPSVLALREFLNQHRSPLQRKCIIAIRMICTEHKNDLDQILQDNRQLKDEIQFEMNRVKQRTEEANRILDEYLKKVADFHRRQRRMSRPAEAQEQQDVEMVSPEKENSGELAEDANRTPQRQPPVLAMKTPLTAIRSRTEHQSTPQSRPLSPKTLKKLRRSLGALIKPNNEARLNAPDLNDTQMDETTQQPEVSRKGANQKKTVEGEVREQGEDEVEKEKEKQGVREGDEVEEEKTAEEDAEAEKTVTEKEETEPVEQEEEEDGMQTAIERTLQKESPSEEPAIEEPATEIPAIEQPDEQANGEDRSADRSRSRRRKTPNYDDNEIVDSEGTVWKKPKIAPASPENPNPADTSMNVTVRKSRRTTGSQKETETERQKKRKSVEEEEQEANGNQENARTTRGMTPLLFDEDKVGAGRQCSTPIKGRDDGEPADMTFSLNLSAITEKEELKNRKSQAQLLQNIFEEDEETE